MIWYLDSTPVQKNQECAVPLGVQGDNQTLRYTADVSDWLALWPSGVVALVLQAPDRSEPYMANTSIDRETGIVTWTVTAFDTSIVGYGYGELRIVENDVIKKSYRFATYIRPSILATAAEPPAPYPDWITELLEAASDTQANVVAAQAAQTAAEAAQSAAEESAGTAATFAEAAAASATSAASSKEAAASSAVGAHVSETRAANFANYARGYSTEAHTSAIQAAGSATDAAGSATQAAGSVTAAETAQASAETAQAAAEAAQAAAETAQGKAEDAQAAAEAAASSAISDIQTQQQTSVAAVQSAGQTQITNIESKGAQTIASIPADYTTLSGDVSNLKSALSEENLMSVSWEHGSYNSLGNKNDSSSTIFIRTVDALSIPNGCTITNQDGFLYRVYYYSDLGVYQDRSDWNNGTKKIQAGGKITLVVKKPGSPEPTIDPSEGVNISIVETSYTFATKAEITELDNKIDNTNTCLSNVTEGYPNLYSGDSSITFVTQYDYTLSKPLPAGTYTLSALPVTDDTTQTKCRFVINPASEMLVKDLNRNIWNGNTFTCANSISVIRFMAATNTSSSTGKTATWSNIMLEAGSGSGAYQPYELTAVDKKARSEFAKEVYVSTSGNDTTGNGTSVSPYATIGKALSTGATIIKVEVGVYNEIVTINNRQNISIVPYPRPVYDSAKTVIRPQVQRFYINNSRFITIEDFLIDADGLADSCVRINNSYGIKITQCEAQNGATGGFVVFDSNVEFTNCVAHDIGNETTPISDGFNFHNYGSSVMNGCVAYNCTDDGASHHEQTVGVIENCLFYNCGSTVRGSGIAPVHNSIIRISNCIIHDCHSGLECADSTNPAYVVGTVLYNNDVDIYCSSPVIIYNTKYGTTNHPENITDLSADN